MPRGGARPNSGPKKGAKYMMKVERTAADLSALEQRSRKLSDARHSKDLLAEAAKYMFGCMTACRPRVVKIDGTDEQDLKWRSPEHERLFFAFADRMGLFAARAAPFEDPTYRAIAIVSQGSGEKPHHLLDANIVALDDAMGASRIYARMMKETKVA